MAVSAAVLSHCVGAICLLFVICQGTDGLKCIICNSVSLPDCATTATLPPSQDCFEWCQNQGSFIPPVNATDETQRTRCPAAEEYNVCRKVDYTLYRDPNTDGQDETRTFRSCGYAGDDSSNLPEKTIILDRSTRTVYNCKGDDCNAGALLKAHFFIPALTLFFLL